MVNRQDTVLYFYGLAADRQEYCFTTYYYLFIFLFIKFIFEPQQLFFQIRIKKSWGSAPLSFSKCLLVTEKKNKMSLFLRIFQIFRKSL